MLKMMLFVVQRSKHPIMAVLVQLRSFERCQEEKKTSNTNHENTLQNLRHTKKHTHTRGRRHAPFSTNVDEIVVLLTNKTFPIISTHENKVVLPFPVGRWVSNYQFQASLQHVQRLEPRRSSYLAGLITK